MKYEDENTQFLHMSELISMLGMRGSPLPYFLPICGIKHNFQVEKLLKTTKLSRYCYYELNISI